MNLSKQELNSLLENLQKFILFNSSGSESSPRKVNSNSTESGSNCDLEEEQGKVFREAEDSKKENLQTRISTENAKKNSSSKSLTDLSIISEHPDPQSSIRRESSTSSMSIFHNNILPLPKSSNSNETHPLQLSRQSTDFFWSSNTTYEHPIPANYRRFARNRDPEFNLDAVRLKREKAREYKQQLEKQIEEKHYKLATTLRNDRLEDETLERKLMEQREKMREEFEREHSKEFDTNSKVVNNPKHNRSRSVHSIRSIQLASSIGCRLEDSEKESIDEDKEIDEDFRTGSTLQDETKLPRIMMTTSDKNIQNQTNQRTSTVSTQTDLSLLVALFDQLCFTDFQSRDDRKQPIMLTKSAQKNRYQTTIDTSLQQQRKIHRSQSKSLTHLNKIPNTINNNTTMNGCSRRTGRTGGTPKQARINQLRSIHHHRHHQNNALS